MYYISKLLRAVVNMPVGKVAKRFAEHFSMTLRSLTKLIAASEHNRAKKIDRFRKLGNDKGELPILVIDLDETLIHSSFSSLRAPCIEITFKTSNNLQEKMWVKIRPFARQVLAKLATFNRIVIFTASDKFYADQIIDLLDPDGKIISNRFYRENCLDFGDGIQVKDLRIIGDLQSTIIIDNHIHSFGMQMANGILILPYFGDDDDEELLELENFVEVARKVNNLQGFLQEYFGYKEYVESVLDRNALINRLVDRIPKVEDIIRRVKNGDVQLTLI